MSRSFLEIPEASGRTLSTLRVYDDPPCGREVHLVFTDGTELSIDVELISLIKTRHYRVDGVDLDILQRHEG